MRRWRSLGRLGATSLVLLVVGCSFDWARLDPREGGGSGGAGAATGGAATSTGGAGGSGTGGGTATGTGGGGTGGAGGDPDCLIALEDAFDVIDDQLWDYATQGVGCDHSVASGELALSCVADASPRGASVTSTASYDLSRCGVLVQLDDFSVMGDATFGLELTDGAGGVVRFTVTGLELTSQIAAPSVDVSYTNGLVPDDHEWWRIRGEAGCIVWETSGDGKGWSEYYDSCALGLSEMTVALTLEITDATSTAQVLFDNVNLP